MIWAWGMPPNPPRPICCWRAFAAFYCCAILRRYWFLCE